jgi:hypothetical protein
MFNSTILDVAVGLIFTFLAVSLAVSSIVEGIASAMHWRSNTLLDGIKTLLNDPELKGLALKIYNHALIDPHDSGTAQNAGDLRNKPSYIDPGQFADALLQITGTATGAAAPTKTAIADVQDNQMRGLLEGIFDRTGGDAARMRAELARWFDNSMDRVSGVYKRRTQLVSFLIALGLALSCNIDAIKIGTALWQQPMIARTIAPQPKFEPAGALAQIGKLGVPIGWTSMRFADLQSTLGLEMGLGWLITAIATLFGAAFWFDALEQFVRLKGSGPSPAEKITATGAAG